MSNALKVLVFLLAGCREPSVQPAQAQAVGPGNLQQIVVLDGGICAGKGSAGDPFHCELVTDPSIHGTGSAGSPLNTTETVAGFTFALFGDGSDGTFTFDGTTPFIMRNGVTIAPIGNEYKITQEVFCHNCTINSGVNVRTDGGTTSGSRFFDDGILTLEGTIHRNGNNASGATAGASVNTTTYLIGMQAGGNGTTGTGSTGGAVLNAFSGCSNTGGTGGNPGVAGGACRGGGGGNGSSGAGGASGAITVVASANTNLRLLDAATTARATKVDSNTPVQGGSGGGGGGGNGSLSGGGGGGGAGYVVVMARAITGAGSIEARGGNGANGTGGGNTGGGGGGGGGNVIVVVASGSCPTLVTTGGTGGTGSGTGGAGGAGGSGIPKCFVLRP